MTSTGTPMMWALFAAFVLIALLTAFPQIALFLPDHAR